MTLRRCTLATIAAAALWLVACSGPPAPTPDVGATPEAAVATPAGGRPAWALAIHGGAGTIPRDTPVDQIQAYEAALQGALAAGRDALEAGEPALAVVEMVVRLLEDAPQFNAGKGAVFTNAGTHELDAAIMDGSTLAAGAVSGLETVKNPVSLARLVMQNTRHVFLVGDGAEQFATEMGVDRVEQDYFFTQRRHDSWRRAQEAEATVGGDGAGDALAAENVDGSNVDGYYGTVGAVALDRSGNLAAATSTGGLTNKRFGRVGDVPVIGAGTYANNASCAVSGTGIGEQFIRHTVASDIAARMTYGGATLQAAAEAVIHGELQAGDGGVIAVSKDGEIALVFNSVGMFRGAANADGRFEVAIWEAREQDG